MLPHPASTRVARLCLSAAPPHPGSCSSIWLNASFLCAPYLQARATHICLDCGFIYTLPKPFDEQVGFRRKGLGAMDDGTVSPTCWLLYGSLNDERAFRLPHALPGACHGGSLHSHSVVPHFSSSSLHPAFFPPLPPPPPRPALGLRVPPVLCAQEALRRL